MKHRWRMPRILRHVGLFAERCEHNPREKAFAETWEKDNTDRAGVNHGYGILQDLFIEGIDQRFPHMFFKYHLIVNNRDAFVVATVIQWLGTNVGMAFVIEALEKVGYRIITQERANDLHEQIVELKQQLAQAREGVGEVAMATGDE